MSRATKKLRSQRKTTARYRNDAQIMKDRAETAQRLLKGQSILQISGDMGIPYELLRFDIKQIEKQWAESAVRDFDHAKEIAVRKLENLEAVYWDAWERSRQQKVRTTQKGSLNGSGKGKSQFKVLEGSTMKEEVYGDPRFLLGVRQCIMDIAKIRGVIQDNKTDAPPPLLPGHGQATVIILPPINQPRAIPAIQIESAVRKTS